MNNKDVIMSASGGYLLLLLALSVGGAAADSAPLIFRDFTHGDSLEVKASLPGYSPSSIAYGDADGQRVLMVSICGVAWGELLLPPVILDPARTYRLDAELRCVGQVEQFAFELPGVGGFAWPASPEWRHQSIQFKPAKAGTLDRWSTRFRGNGTLQVRRLSLSAQDDFVVPPAPAGDRGELLPNPNFVLGRFGWVLGWNHEKRELSPEAFGVFDAGVGCWRLPKGYGVVELFPTTTLDLSYGKTYTLSVDADMPVHVVLRRGDTVEHEWRLPAVSGPATADFVLVPPTTGFLDAAGGGVRHLLVDTTGPGVVRRLSLCEGAAVAAPVSSAVEFVGWPDPLNRQGRVGRPLPFRVRATPAETRITGRLVVSDQHDRPIAEQPLNLGHLDDGSWGADGVLPPLPAGWYEVRLELPGNGVRALRRACVVLPDLDLVAKGRSLGVRQVGYFSRENRFGTQKWRMRLVPARVEELADIGFGLAKVFNGWGACEPIEGQWTWGNQSEIQTLTTLGIQPLLVLSYPPDWAAVRKVPKDWDRWSDAVKRMVRHFRGLVDTYVVANEPDLERIPVADHNRMCAVAYAAAKSVDPQATIVAGSVTTSGRAYLLDCLRAGLLDSCDVIAFHGYVREQSSHFGPASFDEVTVPLRNEMQRQGKVRPIWDAEAAFDFGIAEGLAGTAWSEVHLKSIVCRQAAGITRLYSWGGGDVGWPGGGHFSMYVGQDRAPTVAQGLIAVWTALLGDATFVRRLGDDAAGVHLYAFRSGNGEQVLVGWRSSGEANTLIPLPDLAPLRAIDDMGRPAKGVAPNGLLLDASLRYFLTCTSTLDAPLAARPLTP